MQIETKYNIGDKVYTIAQNKVTNFIIGRIDIKIDGKETSIVYTSKDIYEEYSLFSGANEPRNLIRSEDKIFTSKEDLLKSL